MISDNILNAYHTFKKNPFWVKLLFALFFVNQFFRSFIFVTTNSIYKQELSTALGPFVFYSFVIQIVSFFILIIYFFRIKKLNEAFVFGSFVFLIGMIVLGLYGLCPCLFEHSDSLTDHIHPHSISYKLKQSFLCPTYSHNSRFHILFCFVIGCIIFKISSSRMKN